MTSTIQIERHALRVAIESAAIAQSDDDLRSHLAGVHLDFGPTTLVASASDGHRLVQTTVPTLQSEGDPATAFIHRDDVKRALKSLRCKKTEQAEPVTVEVGDVVRISGPFETLEFANRDEPAPPYAKVIPERRESGDKGPGLFALNTKYIGDVGILGRLLKAEGTTISTSFAREAVRFDLSNGRSSSVYIVMPMRL